MQMNLFVTGYYADDQFGKIATIKEITFDTVDAADDHGFLILARIEDAVDAFVSGTEAQGLDRTALIYQHMAEIAHRVRNFHNGEDFQTSYVTSYIDEHCYKVTLSVGPAE